jgi:hypothetical protein
VVSGLRDGKTDRFQRRARGLEYRSGGESAVDPPDGVGGVGLSMGMSEVLAEVSCRYDGGCDQREP